LCSRTIAIKATLTVTMLFAVGLMFEPLPAAAAPRPTTTGAVAVQGASLSAESSTVPCRAEGFTPVHRESVIKRGKKWVKDNVPYDQGKCHKTAAKTTPDDRYRTDCSGFVSMAWALDGSYTTADFARDRKGRWHTIPWGDLEPGDAIVAHTHDLQHMVLFVKWEGSDRTELKSYESRGEDVGTVANVRRVADMKAAGFHPIRHSHIEG
jgi:cell wall-associated NlpC family hydrolase